MSESDTEKKRNKLGYTRISIACAHCRRRKIRCVVDGNDSRQRCRNCIRLKKECVFNPVEQQVTADDRAQTSGRTEPSSPAASSPATLGQEGDGAPSYGEFASIAPNVPVSDHRMLRSYGDTLPTESQMAGSAGPTAHFSQDSPWHQTSAYQSEGHPDFIRQYQQNQLHVDTQTSAVFASYPAYAMSHAPHQYNAHATSYDQADSNLSTPQTASSGPYQPAVITPHANVAYAYPYQQLHGTLPPQYVGEPGMPFTHPGYLVEGPEGDPAAGSRGWYTGYAQYHDGANNQ